MKKGKILLPVVLLLLSGVWLVACSTEKKSSAESPTIELRTQQVHTVGENKDLKKTAPKLVKPKMQSKAKEEATESSEKKKEEAQQKEEDQQQQQQGSSQQTTTSSKAKEATMDTSAIQKTDKVMPNHLYYDGWSIPYKNGGMAQGQAVIDSDPQGISSTWGGKTPFSGNDGLNTHFIGHHWGAFDCFAKVPVGATIKVTDGQGNIFSYTVVKTAIVNQVAVDTKTGKNLYSEITSTGGGERIVVQTCLSETTRNIIFAMAG